MYKENSNRPLSSRQRRPGSASNYHQTCQNGVLSARRPASARANDPDSARIRNITDPLYVNRNVSRDIFDLVDTTHSKLALSALPPSRHPTVTPYEFEKPRYKKPPITPQEWINQNSAPAFNIKADREERKVIVRKFIERNIDYMGEYNTDYKQKSHHDIYNLIMDSNNFNSTMLQLQAKERNIRKGNSSRQVKTALKDDHLSSIYEPRFDPFILTYQSPRDLRQQKMISLFAPSLSERNIENIRGYKHAPEYGNFSDYNNCLVRNQSAMLNR